MTPARRRGRPAPEHWFGAGHLPTWQVYPSALLAHWRYRGAHRARRHSVRVGDIAELLEGERRRGWFTVWVDGKEYLERRANVYIPGLKSGGAILMVAPPNGIANYPANMPAAVSDD